MKRNLFSKLIKLCFGKAIRSFVLLGAAGCLALSFIALQQDSSVTGQEKSDNQSVERERASDDPADISSLPSFVYDCIDNNEWLLKEVNFPTVQQHNPYFTRGDFDGDKNIDYAVVVESLKNRRHKGLVVCFRNKETKAVLLGLDPKNPPSFRLLANWDVETLEEVSKMTDSAGRSLGIKPKGESIIMRGEDWSGIIYWDGRRFQWKEVILNDDEAD